MDEQDGELGDEEVSIPFSETEEDHTRFLIIQLLLKAREYESVRELLIEAKRIETYIKTGDTHG